MHNNWLVWKNVSELQWRDLNDSLSFDSALFSLSCVIWWIAGDASDSFYCRDIHLYSLISPHIPQQKMPLQGFLSQDFCLCRDHKKKKKKLNNCGVKNFPTLLTVKIETFAACGWQSHGSQFRRTYYVGFLAVSWVVMQKNKQKKQIGFKYIACSSCTTMWTSYLKLKAFSALSFPVSKRRAWPLYYEDTRTGTKLGDRARF